jgi:hypothetical protein
MITTKALIRLPYHDVLVQIDDLGHIQLFKYSESTKQCDFITFEQDQSIAASEWVHDLLPRVTYSITSPDGEQIL